MNNEVIIPAGVGSIDITLEIVDDDLVERTEYLSINFFSRVAELNIGGGLRIANNMFDVAILDNDGKTSYIYDYIIHLTSYCSFERWF